MLEAEWQGAPLSVEVGPAAVNGKHAVVRLVLSTTSKKNVGLSQPFGSAYHPGTMVAIRMLSLDKGLVYRELDEEVRHLYDGVEKDKPLEVFPVFHAPPEDVGVVDLLLPYVGIATGVPVLKDTETDFSVKDVVSKAKLDESEAGPFKIETMSLAADDVTFATDSDQLSAQADSVLASVVEQIKKYPSGGDLTITGHTDDVADDAHNQDLSERRARAVSDRLKKLTDLSKWKESVSGKGESSPRVPNDSDEHRQANRRVEITLMPSKPAEASAPPSASVAPSSTAMPKAAGPVGKGPEGVDVIVDGKRLHMTMERMVRIGRYLTGSLELSSQQEMDLQMSSFALPSTMQTLADWVMGGVYSLTLLSGGTRYMEADFESADWGRLPAAMTALVGSVHPGEPLRLPVVWPDIGGDSAVIDIPGGEARGPGRVVARLTDIPIINA